ncbi:MAG: hypothetical protein DRI39_08630 [Chloroflexi bacterium]|nr:MAG: hypothetical protein DRI39_08630 [Chloroflexota bacterium]
MTEEFVGYDKLLRFVEERGLQNLEGDLVEIGAYMGGGTVKLASFAQKHGKRVFAIDVFDPSVDSTLGKGGVKASDVYQAYLLGRSMLEVYRETTSGFDNIVTIAQDSMKVRFPNDQRFMFGFVDGCHQQAYVKNDFHVIWPHLVSGGVLGFHDYKFDDWPEVTRAVDSLIDEHRAEIREAHELEAGYGILSMMLVKK